MDAQFEEKTFEGYLNNELDRSSRFFFPFGQVQEGVIGLDAAFNSRNFFLWKRLGYLPWECWGISGADLKDIAAEMESFIGKIARNIPTLRVNLLFQYKRPEYISSSRGNEWSHWRKPYFRYELYREQHSLLSHLADAFNHTALVLYAAPAVKQIDELVRIHNRGAMIKNTNFTRAKKLDGHHVNTYVRAGNHSIACSDPESIEATDIFDAITSFEVAEEANNSVFLRAFGSRLTAAFGEAHIAPTYQSAFSQRVENLGIERLGDYPLFKAHLEVAVFSEVTGVRWLSAF